MSKLAGKLHDEFEKTIRIPETETVKEELTVDKVKTTTVPKHLKSDGGIVVDGEHGCMVKYARCCNPLPGDDVIGFITKGYGISIHKADCPNVALSQRNPENESRWVEAHWENVGSNEHSMYEASITVHVLDRLGIVADISVALSDMKVFLLQINTVKSTGDRSIIHLKISCKNVDHYHSIVSRLKAISGVTDVVRSFS